VFGYDSLTRIFLPQNVLDTADIFGDKEGVYFSSKGIYIILSSSGIGSMCNFSLLYTI
jgi:hypothetical protein